MRCGLRMAGSMRKTHCSRLGDARRTASAGRKSAERSLGMARATSASTAEVGGLRRSTKQGITPFYIREPRLEVACKKAPFTVWNHGRKREEGDGAPWKASCRGAPPNLPLRAGASFICRG